MQNDDKRGRALGTVLFADPDAPSRVREELADEIKTLGFDTPEDVFGAALDTVVS